MKWTECTIKQALLHSNGKEMREEKLYCNRIFPLPDFGMDIVEFADGTAVGCLSEWQGPLSDVTPEIDALPPKWWIFS